MTVKQKQSSAKTFFMTTLKKPASNWTIIILSSIADYLPVLKRTFGKSALGKAYSGMQVPTPEQVQQADLIQFKDLIKKFPDQKPDITIDPTQDIAALPYTGGNDRAPPRPPS